MNEEKQLDAKIYKLKKELWCLEGIDDGDIYDITEELLIEETPENISEYQKLKQIIKFGMEKMFELNEELEKLQDLKLNFEVARQEAQKSLCKEGSK